MLPRSSTGDHATVARLARDVTAAITRRTAAEAKLAGAVRVLGPFLPELSAALSDACARLLRRKSSARPLFVAGVGALLTAGHEDGPSLAEMGLAASDEVPLGLCAAAAQSSAPELEEVLARLSSGRHAHLAYGAELARVARGASRGARLGEIGPRLRESSRVALINEVIVPLVGGPKLVATVAPGLAILRNAERHLGRWLVIAELAHRAGDLGPLEEAESRSRSGPSSTRVSWSLLAWALRGGPAPKVRPTFDLLARLSDRPTAQKDMTFLHRLGGARSPEAAALLESMIGDRPLAELDAVRAARALALGYDHGTARDRLIEAAESKREAVRGPATAALYDLGEKARATELAEPLAAARAVGSFAWGALVRLAVGGRVSGPLLTEPVARALAGAS